MYQTCMIGVEAFRMAASLFFAFCSYFLGLQYFLKSIFPSFKHLVQYNEVVKVGGEAGRITARNWVGLKIDTGGLKQ